MDSIVGTSIAFKFSILYFYGRPSFDHKVGVALLMSTRIRIWHENSGHSQSRKLT